MYLLRGSARVQNAHIVHFVLLRTCSGIFPEQVGRSTKCTICAFCILADRLRKFPEEVHARAGCGTKLCVAWSSHGAGPCVVTEMGLAWSRKMRDLTSKPDMGPRGSPVPLKSHGTGPGLVMERGRVQSRNGAVPGQEQ